MKMVVAIVRDEFAAALTEQLSRRGFGATKLASNGGFLKAGNTTFMIGVAAAQLDEAMAVIEATCSGKKTGAQPSAGDVAMAGATCFVLDVEKMVKA